MPLSLLPKTQKFREPEMLGRYQLVVLTRNYSPSFPAASCSQVEVGRIRILSPEAVTPQTPIWSGIDPSIFTDKTGLLPRSPDTEFRGRFGSVLGHLCRA